MQKKKLCYKKKKKKKVTEGWILSLGNLEGVPIPIFSLIIEAIYALSANPTIVPLLAPASGIIPWSMGKKFFQKKNAKTKKNKWQKYNHKEA